MSELQDLVDDLLGPVHLACGQPVAYRERVVPYRPYSVHEIWCEHCQVVICNNHVGGRLPVKHWSLDQLM